MVMTGYLVEELVSVLGKVFFVVELASVRFEVLELVLTVGI